MAPIDPPQYPAGWIDAWRGSGAWGITYPDNVEGLLQGISCYQADMCEAVGEQPYGALVVQFKKNLYAYEQTAPSPSGATDVDLLSVSCASKKDCIAVGSYVDFVMDGFAWRRDVDGAIKLSGNHGRVYEQVQRNRFERNPVP